MGIPNLISPTRLSFMSRDGFGKEMSNEDCSAFFLRVFRPHSYSFYFVRHKTLSRLRPHSTFAMELLVNVQFLQNKTRSLVRKRIRGRKNILKPTRLNDLSADAFITLYREYRDCYRHYRASPLFVLYSTRPAQEARDYILSKYLYVYGYKTFT